MRLIDADALTRCIEQKFDAHYGNTCYQFIHDFFRCVQRLIRKAPTIEARPVVRGEWKQSILADDFFRCSVCSSVWNRKFEFCPHCGADMRGVEDAD